MIFFAGQRCGISSRIVSLWRLSVFGSLPRVPPKEMPLRAATCREAQGGHRPCEAAGHPFRGRRLRHISGGDQWRPGRSTSSAILSFRSPRKDGCRRLPPVYSRYSTSQTRIGLDQDALRVTALGGSMVNGLIG